MNGESKGSGLFVDFTIRRGSPGGGAPDSYQFESLFQLTFGFVPVGSYVSF